MLAVGTAENQKVIYKVDDMSIGIRRLDKFPRRCHHKCSDYSGMLCGQENEIPQLTRIGIIYVGWLVIINSIKLFRINTWL